MFEVAHGGAGVIPANPAAHPPGPRLNLFALYLATLVMRSAAFAGVAVMQHVLYPDPRDAFWKGLLFTVFPLAEVLTVGYYGARCDRIGRKRTLVFAHAITAAAVFLFIPAIGLVTPGPPAPYLVAVGVDGVAVVPHGGRAGTAPAADRL